MKITTTVLTLFALVVMAVPTFAQAPVVGHPDPESLFTSKDPKLHANKQVVLHIMRDLLEANHWSDAPKYLSQRYIQHNPNVASGLDPVMKFFGSRPQSPIPARNAWRTKIVSVVAEGDLVVVGIVRELPDPRKPGSNVHDHVVRHVAHPGRQGGRTLGLRDDRSAHRQWAGATDRRHGQVIMTARRVRAAALFLCASAVATPAFAQGGYIGAFLVADVVRFDQYDSAVPDDSGNGEALGFALRLGTGLGSRWGVEVEFVRPGEITSEQTPEILPLMTPTAESAPAHRCLVYRT